MITVSHFASAQLNGIFDKIYFGGGFGFDFNQNISSFNLTPYAGLNATYFLGKQSDTQYDGPRYGEGGPHTYVRCLGVTPNLGFFVNSGFLKGYGLSVERLLLECENDQIRSMENGYEADFDITQYRIDYRIPF